VIGYISARNCLLKHVTEGLIEGTGREERRRKQLLDDIKEIRRYWDLKLETLVSTLHRTRFGKNYGPIARQTTQGMINEYRPCIHYTHTHTHTQS
jgi:hypothetical protein